MNDDYKEWYNEAIIVSNDLGFAGMSAADVIKFQAEELEDYHKGNECFNAVISYMLGKGQSEEPLQFLRCWNEGNFDALREEWPYAPEEIYLADPLYGNNKQ